MADTSLVDGWRSELVATHEVWLTDDRGATITLIEGYERLAYGMSVHGVGACTLVLPGDFDKTLVQPDFHLEIWRDYDGGHRQLERVYFIRPLRQNTESNANERLYVDAFDSNMLVAVRGVMYRAGNAYSVKTGTVDDVMKAYVRENCGTLAGTGRPWNSSYFTVQADNSAGPTVTDYSASFRNLLTTLQDLAESARAAGTPVYFDVVPVEPDKFEFRTFTGQPGADRSSPDGNNPVLIGSEFGNLTEINVTEHYEDEATVVYAAGQGEGAARTVVIVEDAARSGRSIWGRREAFQDARQHSTSNGVTAAANRRLAEGEPWIEFTGRLVDTPQAPYGDWRWGDKFTASHKGQSYTSIVTTVRVEVDRDGKEGIDARLEYIG